LVSGMLGASIGRFIYSSSWELARCKLDTVGVQVFGWDIEGALRAGDCNYVYGKYIKAINWEEDNL